MPKSTGATIGGAVGTGVEIGAATGAVTTTGAAIVVVVTTASAAFAGAGVAAGTGTAGATIEAGGAVIPGGGSKLASRAPSKAFSATAIPLVKASKQASLGNKTPPQMIATRKGITPRWP